MLINKIKQGSLLDLIALFTPCIILIGAAYKLGFYDSKNIDALWLISLFSPVDFMVSNVIIYLYYVLALLYMDKIIDGRDKLIGGLISANVVLFCSFLGMIFFSKAEWIFVLNAIVALNCFAAVLYSNHHGFRVIGIVAILVGLPYFNGKNEADNLTTKELPIVTLKKENNIYETWILLDKFSDKAILMHKIGEKNEFKIVELKDIERISQSKF